MIVFVIHAAHPRDVISDGAERGALLSRRGGIACLRDPPPGLPAPTPAARQVAVRTHR